MDNKSNQTVGIDEESRSEFTTISTGNSKNETSEKSQQPDGEITSRQEKGSGWGDIPKNLMDAVKDDFSTSAFVLILIGYVIIETFGESGIDFREYILLIILLFAITGTLKTFKIEGFWGNLINALNTKKFLLVAVLILLLDVTINHWEILAMLFEKVSTFFETTQTPTS